MNRPKLGETQAALVADTARLKAAQRELRKMRARYNLSLSRFVVAYLRRHQKARAS